MDVDVDVIIIVIEPIQILHHQSDDFISDFLIPCCIFEDVGDAFVSISIVQ